MPIHIERSSIQQDMKNCKLLKTSYFFFYPYTNKYIIACFICSIPAVEFQRHAKKGFEDHVKNDHNIW